MSRVAETQDRLESLGELDGVVHALRSISAARVQQAHGVLESLRAYTAIVHAALADAVQFLPVQREVVATSEESALVVVLGSEHGFVGGVNDRLFDVATSRTKPGDRLLVVGARAMIVAKERGLRMAWSGSTASQASGIDEVALRVAEGLSQVEKTRAATRILLVYTRRTGGNSEVVANTLVPFDFRRVAPVERIRPTALSNLAPVPLLEQLTSEAIFAELARAIAEAFASENAARLATMESASDNIAGKLEELRRIERELRQDEITTELLEVVTGVEALRARDPSEALARRR